MVRLWVVTNLIAAMFMHAAAAPMEDCKVLAGLNWPDVDASWRSGDSGADCCLWAGVTCDAAHSAITALRLANRSLGGTLPASFGLLRGLRSLDLSANALHGTLPADWATASSLMQLSVARNSLTGELPPAWGAGMPQLQSLDLSYNLLSGGLPPQWQSWTSLRSFVLSNNRLSGSLPPEYSALTQLRRLDFTYNQLSGTLPASWATLTAMSYKSVSSNGFNGSLPEAWSSMRGIQFLGAESNFLLGSVPHSWCQFSSAYVAVNLGSNLLDTIPLGIFSDPACRLGLMLGENRFSGSLPSTILAPLVGLVMNHNNLSGAVPRYNNIAVFDVSYNQLTEFPCVEGAVATIHVVGNPIASLPDPAACVMPNVTTLVLSGCPLASMPLALDMMLPNLTTFVASNTTRRSSTQQLPRLPADKLNILDLSRNNFAACPSEPVRMGSDPVYLDVTETSSDAMCNSIRRFSCSSTLCLGLTGGLNVSCSVANCLMRLNDRVGVNTTRYIFGQAPAGVLKLYFHSQPRRTSLEDVASFMFLLKYQSPKLNDTIVVDFYKFLTTEISVSYQPALLVRSAMPAWAAQQTPSWNSSVVQMPPIPSSWLAFTSLDATMLLHNVTYALQFLFVSENPQVLFVDKSYVVAETADFTALPCSAGLVGVPFTTLCAGCPAMATCDGTASLTTSVGWRAMNNALPFYQCLPTSKGCAAGDGTACRDGYTGPLCSVCKPGFGSDANGKCTRCYASGLNVALVVIVGLVGLFLVTVAVYKSAVYDRDALPLEVTISRRDEATSWWTAAGRRAWLLIQACTEPL